MASIIKQEKKSRFLITNKIVCGDGTGCRSGSSLRWKFIWVSWPGSTLRCFMHPINWNEYGKVCNVGNIINLLHTFWDWNVDAVYKAVEDKALRVTYSHSKYCEVFLLVISYFWHHLSGFIWSCVLLKGIKKDSVPMNKWFLWRTFMQTSAWAKP